MGAGASVYKGNVSALWDLYNARRGWFVREGRLQINNTVAFPDENEPTMTDAPTIDYNTDSDEATGINYDSDEPYAEAYDGPMADDHPMVVELRIGMYGPDPPPVAEVEAEHDGWVTPDGVMSSSSASWEPITNTRGGLFMPFDDDWIPDFETESE